MHPNDGKVIFAKIAPPFFFSIPSLLLAHLLLVFHRFTRPMANAPGTTSRGVGWMPHFATRFICHAHFPMHEPHGDQSKKLCLSTRLARFCSCAVSAGEAATENGWMDNSEYTSNHLRALTWFVTMQLAAPTLRISARLTFRSNSLLAAGWDYTIPWLDCQSMEVQSADLNRNQSLSI